MHTILSLVTVSCHVSLVSTAITEQLCNETDKYATSERTLQGLNE